MYAGTQSGKSISLYEVESNYWGENSITWINSPQKGKLLQKMSVPVNDSFLANFDVTNYVKTQKGKKEISFCIESSGFMSNEGNMIFASKENASSRPALSVKLK